VRFRVVSWIVFVFSAACQELVGGDVVGSHLRRVANQKLATGDSRVVPGPAFDSGEARDLGILLRRGLYQGQLSVITRHY